MSLEIVRVLNNAEVRQRLFDSGAEVVASSPAELAAAMKSEMATAGKLIQELDISTR
jgi:tripartite-type tricarboxylate transporter receptor subunit TctC